jgi:hypothetical protein
MHSPDSYSTGELAFGMEPVSINDPRPLEIFPRNAGLLREVLHVRGVIGKVAL